MEGNKNSILTGPPPLHQNNPAADGINVTTNTKKNNVKALALRNIIEKDLQAADFKWSLFVAACQNYRFESRLKPFPPDYIVNGTKDIDSLREVVDRTSALPLLGQHLYDPDIYERNSQVIDLMYWVLFHHKEMRIKSVPKSEFEMIMKKVNYEAVAPPPNFIFQLVGNPRGASETHWQQVSKGYKTLFAFHGSRLDNFHSILHYGLQQHMNKNSLFGPGIYLSSELSVSLPYSPVGYGWGRSIFGGQLSCVALCEIVNHPDVKCQDKDSEKSRRSIAKDSIGGEVPKKYYVIPNSDLVKVRYILVYSNCSPHSIVVPTSRSWLGWLGRHKLLTLIVGYMVLLASVGLSNNHLVQRYYHLLLKRVGF